MNHNKKFLSAVGLLLLSTFGMAQDADPIVMHINGSPVPRSEFEYNYNKNNSDGVVVCQLQAESIGSDGCQV